LKNKRKKTTSQLQDGCFASLPLLGFDDQHGLMLIRVSRLRVHSRPWCLLGLLPSSIAY